MGLLDLRFGYFALRGAEGKRDKLESYYNSAVYDKLIKFNIWFCRNRRYLKKFMPTDAKSRVSSFNIVTDDISKKADQLINLSEISDRRFSIVVPDIKVDLLNKKAADHGQTADALLKFYERSNKFEIQIFNINDDETPLTAALLNQTSPSEAAHYLMTNAINSKITLEKWHTRVQQPA